MPFPAPPQRTRQAAARILTHILVPILAALACLLWPAPACAEARESQVQAEWTVMVYMCADNNLEYPAIMDLLEMEHSLEEL